MKWLAPFIIIIVLVIFGAWFCSAAHKTEAEVKDYEIKVAEFNRDSGHGYAYIKMPEAKANASDPDPTVRVDVEKYDAEKHAKTFTGSVHEDAFIKVKGKLDKNGKQPVRLLIVPE